MQKQNMTWKQRIAYIGRWMGYGVIVLLCTISLLGVSGYQITEINAVGGLLAILNGILLHRYQGIELQEKEKRLARIMALVGALSLTTGNIFRNADESGRNVSVGITDIMYLCGIFLFLVLLISMLIAWLKSQKVTQMSFHKPKKMNKDGKEVLIFTIVMVLCWMPYFLTFFPGIFGSDPLESIRQVLGMEGWTNHHPILYTAYIKLFVMLLQGVFGLNGALGVMIFAQMCILAGSLSYCLVWLGKKDVPFGILVFGFLFFAVNPVIGVFSVYATKDVLFSAVVLLFVLAVYDFTEKPELLISEKKYWMKMFLITFFVLFLRNNGIFLIVGTLMVLAFVYRTYWKKFGVWILFVILCMTLQKQVIFQLLHVEEGSFAESLSIPLQQIGQAMVDGPVMSETEEVYLNELLPIDRWAGVYQQGYTDTIKFDEQFNDTYLNEHKGKFIKVWAGMLPKNFGSYVKGYLLQTIGYWDIHQTESLNAYGVVENSLGVEQIDIIQRSTGKSLQGMIEALILVCRKLPVLCYLTNMAMIMFILTFVLIRSGVEHDKCGLSLIPLSLVWITIMIAAPAAVKFRYLFAVYLCWPLIIYHLFRRKMD